MAIAKVKFHSGIESIEIEDKPFDSGGEGSVFKSKDSQYLVKVYHEIDERRRELLEKILLISQGVDNDTLDFLVFPIGIVLELNGKQSLGAVSHFKKDAINLENYMYSPREAFKNFRDSFNYGKYFLIARKTAHAILTLHGLGCAHTDLSHKNILISNKDNSLKIHLIDLDGVVVQGFLPPNVAGTRGYMAPEILMRASDPNKNTDKHSLAVLIYHTLLFRNPLNPTINYCDDDSEESDRLGFGKHALFSEHPDDKRHRPKTLSDMSRKQIFGKKYNLSYNIFPPYFRELFDKVFIGTLFEPIKRPDAREWYIALSLLTEILWPCMKCKLYIPYPYWKDYQNRFCFMCGENLHPPLVMQFSEKSSRKGRGYRKTDHHILLTHNFKLYEYQVKPREIPPLSRKDEKVIGEVIYDSCYKLINKSTLNWYTTKGSLIHPGESIEYEPGLTIVFGDDLRIGQFL